MKPLISILLPSIRPGNLERWYKASELASKKNIYEVIVISPYNLPKELENIGRITHIKSFTNPTVCLQVGALFSRSKFLLISADDLIYFPDSIDKMIDLWDKEKLGEFDTINARYREAALDNNTLLPLSNPPPELSMDYWRAWHHDALKLPYINPNWKISLQPLLLRDTFYKLGGLDTRGFQNSVFPLLQLNMKMQHLGGKIIDSEEETSWAGHLLAFDGDHRPIQISMSQTDEPLFRQQFSTRDELDKLLYLDYNNYKLQDDVWKLRFGDIKKYE